MKKNLLSILILALLVVNILLTSVLMISMVKTNSKTAELVTNIATVMNLELTGFTEDDTIQSISLENTDIYSLPDPITGLLAVDSTGNQGYIVFDIALNMNKQHADYKKYGATISTYEGIIKGVISEAVNSLTKAEAQNMNILKNEILKGIQARFSSDFIYSVSISGVKFG